MRSILIDKEYDIKEMYPEIRVIGAEGLLGEFKEYKDKLTGILLKSVQTNNYYYALMCEMSHLRFKKEALNIFTGPSEFGCSYRLGHRKKKSRTPIGSFMNLNDRPVKIHPVCQADFRDLTSEKEGFKSALETAITSAKERCISIRDSEKPEDCPQDRWPVTQRNLNKTLQLIEKGEKKFLKKLKYV